LAHAATEGEVEMDGKIKIFSGNAGEPLATKVCEWLSISLGNARVGRFADGEVRVQINEDVRDADVFILNPTHPPAENLIETMLLLEAARGSSAGRITLVPVYLGYNRQDRKDRPRVPISARVVIHMLSSCGTDRALLFDIHSEPTMGFFHPRTVVDHLYASWVSVPYLRSILKNPFVVASPDKGGGPRAEAYARLLGQEDYVLFTKIRKPTGEIQEKSIRIIGDVAGKTVLFIDDMIDTGGTLISDAEAARVAGAEKILAFATHALFSRDAVARLDESPIDEVIITDSIPHTQEELRAERIKITVLSIDRLVAEAIRRIHEGASLSSLILE